MRRDIQQCGAKTYNVVQCSVVKCGTAWCETVPCHVEVCTEVQEMRCDAVQHGGGGGKSKFSDLHNKHYMWLEILMEVSIKCMVFWDVILGISVDRYQHFG